MDNVLTVHNGKGGVLKTSLSAQVAGLAAASGWEVLAVDLDPQGNLARDLGYGDRSDDGLEMLRSVETARTPTPLQNVRENLDVLPGGFYTEQLERVLQRGRKKQPMMFAETLAKIASRYDLVVIDSPPGTGELPMAVLTAARAVVVPTQPDSASIDGLSVVASRIEAAHENGNDSLSILGVVIGPTPSGATRIREDVQQRLAELVGESVHVFDRQIRLSQAAAIACRERGLLVHEYEAAESGRRFFAKASHGLAEDYEVLVEDILARFTALPEVD
jgi:chromosome partitioning protein